MRSDEYSYSTVGQVGLTRAGSPFGAPVYPCIFRSSVLSSFMLWVFSVSRFCSNPAHAVAVTSSVGPATVAPFFLGWDTLNNGEEELVETLELRVVSAVPDDMAGRRRSGGILRANRSVIRRCCSRGVR